MICPVCKNDIQEYYTVCPICNYYGLHQEFLNIEDALIWEEQELPYFKALWLRKNTGCANTINLETKEAIEVFNKYFTNTDHKYRIYFDADNSQGFINVSSKIAKSFYSSNLSSAKWAKNLSKNSSVFSASNDIVEKAEVWDVKFTGIEINTKYLSFAFMKEGNKNPQFFCDYGHANYRIEYMVEKECVSIFVVPVENESAKEFICAISTRNTVQYNELIVILEFLKAGSGHFQEPFDTTVLPVDEFSNEELTYDTYFRNGPIKPLTFYAEVSDFEEDNEPEEMLEEHGLCKITLRVTDLTGNPAPNIEDLFVGDNQYQLITDMVRILKPNGPLGYHSYSMLNEDNRSYDFYINRKKKTIYYGTPRDYRKFQFEDELLMQQVFNYLVILNSHWIM